MTTQDDDKTNIEKLKQIQNYMPKNACKIQMNIIHDELMELIEKGVSPLGLYRYFVNENKFNGHYDTFLRNLKKHLSSEQYERISGTKKRKIQNEENK